MAMKESKNPFVYCAKPEGQPESMIKMYVYTYIWITIESSQPIETLAKWQANPLTCDDGKLALVCGAFLIDVIKVFNIY